MKLQYRIYGLSDKTLQRKRNYGGFGIDKENNRLITVMLNEAAVCAVIQKKEAIDLECILTALKK